MNNNNDDEKYNQMFTRVIQAIMELGEHGAAVALSLSLDKPNGFNPTVIVLNSILDNESKLKNMLERLFEDSNLYRGKEDALREVHIAMYGKVNMNERVVAVITPNQKHTSLMETSFHRILAVVDKSKAYTLIDGMLSVITPTNTALVKSAMSVALSPVFIVASQLVFSAVTAIRDWYYGKATGQWALAQFTNSLSSLGAGCVAGSIAFSAGAVVGGPLAAILFGCIASYYTASTVKDLSTKFTQRLFNLAPTQELDLAYKFMEISPKSSITDINAQYRKLALLYHPDREWGSAEKWALLQVYLEIIRASKERCPTH